MADTNNDLGKADPNLLQGLLTPEELAQELKVTVRTLYRWHAGRKGPPRLRLGKKTYYRRASVLSWLEEHEEDTPLPYPGARPIRKIKR